MRADFTANLQVFCRLNSGEGCPVWIYLSQFSVDTLSSEAHDAARSYALSEPPVHTDADPDCGTPHNVTQFEERPRPSMWADERQGWRSSFRGASSPAPYHEDGSS